MQNVSSTSTMSVMRQLLLPALANPQIITSTKNTKRKRTHYQHNDTTKTNKQTNKQHTHKQTTTHISTHKNM